MYAIRGATTIECDTPEAIKSGVEELLSEIVTKNFLNNDDIICIMFSNTSDIRSYYPAKAGREAGFFNCALYSSQEPEILNSLKLCIRVMLLVNGDCKPYHVYLHGASKLRKDIAAKINIAIDGPAGSGKSTVSKIVAKKLNIMYLDTGAMYRTCALACVEGKIDVKNEEQVAKTLNNALIDVKYENGAQAMYLNGKNVSDKIRTPEISMLASSVSAFKAVREKMVDMQRDIAKINSCVLDGRDIGTNVLPFAEFKFYLTATPQVRAMRRMKENELKGINQPFDEVLKDIEKRDLQDSMRKIAPLKRADDAIEIDTSNLNIEEVSAIILKSIQERI